MTNAQIMDAAFPANWQNITMIRSELIAKLKTQYPQLTTSDIELAVKTLLESIANSLAQGGRVEIRGFGSFSVHTKPPRLARNPRTGESVAMQERHVPHFKPGIELRERVDVERVNQQDNLTA